MIECVVVVPLWRRTANLDRVAASLAASTPEARPLFVVNHDDATVIEAMADRGWPMLVVPWSGGGDGDYARKINAGYRESTEPFIFTGADDLEFHRGWYRRARALAHPPIGVVGTVDLCNERTMRGEHSTHSLVTRAYADAGACLDADHVIYHEGYDHEYCDDELVQTALVRNAYAHAYDAVVEHRHPNIGAAPMDETYRRGRSRTHVSRSLFRSRSQLWRGVQPWQFSRDA